MITFNDVPGNPTLTITLDGTSNADEIRNAFIKHLFLIHKSSAKVAYHSGLSVRTVQYVLKELRLSGKLPLLRSVPVKVMANG